MVKRFVCYFWFVRWDCISLGLHVSLARPNIEIHLPFGFVRIGWVDTYPDLICINQGEDNWRGFGIGYDH